MKRKVLAAALAVMFVGAPMVAQFAVIDETHMWSNVLHFLDVKANQVKEIALKVQHIARTVEHIQWTVKHFEFVVYQTTQIPGKLARWGTDLIHFRVTGVYGDTYDKNLPWLNAINKGLDKDNAYLNAVERLEISPLASLDRLDHMAQERAKRRHASVELADGTNARVLGVIGDYRSSQMSRQIALLKLKTDTLNEEDGLNTQTAIMQKIASASLVQAQGNENVGELLSSQMEMQLRAAVADREAEVAAMNDEIYRLANAGSFMSGQSSRTTSAFRAMRIP